MTTSTLTKSAATIAVVLVAVLIVAALAWRARARKSSSADLAGGPALRLMFLGLQPGAPPADPPATPHGVWGAAMDLAVRNGSATVISTLSGEASIYFSSGGGILGGVAYDRVRSAARAFVSAAEGCASDLVPGPPQALPQPGHVRFFAHSRNGLLHSEEIAEAEVQEPDHPLHPCYRAAQEVITELRLASPSPGRS